MSWTQMTYFLRVTLLVVDEVHPTGIHDPGDRGMVTQLGLEDRVHAWLHAFGKALAASGGALRSNLN